MPSYVTHIYAKNYLASIAWWDICELHSYTSAWYLTSYIATVSINLAILVVMSICCPSWLVQYSCFTALKLYQQLTETTIIMKLISISTLVLLVIVVNYSAADEDELIHSLLAKVRSIVTGADPEFC